MNKTLQFPLAFKTWIKFRNWIDKEQPLKGRDVEITIRLKNCQPLKLDDIELNCITNKMMNTPKGKIGYTDAKITKIKVK